MQNVTEYNVIPNSYNNFSYYQQDATPPVEEPNPALSNLYPDLPRNTLYPKHACPFPGSSLLQSDAKNRFVCGDVNLGSSEYPYQENNQLEQPEQQQQPHTRRPNIAPNSQLSIAANAPSLTPGFSKQMQTKPTISSTIYLNTPGPIIPEFTPTSNIPIGYSPTASTTITSPGQFFESVPTTPTPQSYQETTTPSAIENTPSSTPTIIPIGYTTGPFVQTIAPNISIGSNMGSNSGPNQIKESPKDQPKEQQKDQSKHTQESPKPPLRTNAPTLSSIGSLSNQVTSEQLAAIEQKYQSSRTTRPNKTQEPKCQYTGWSEWSACQPGSTKRTRTQKFNAPDGTKCNPKTETDNTYCPVDSTISGWTDWSPCVTGSSRRTRTQITIPPKNKGKTIVPKTETDNTTCSIDCKYTGWTEWTTCRPGDYKRTRMQTATREVNNGKPCNPQKQTDPSTCPVDSTETTEWDDWTQCVSGVSMRMRKLITNPPINNGATIMPRKEYDMSYCPVNCMFKLDMSNSLCDQKTGIKNYMVKSFTPEVNDGDPCIYNGTTITAVGQLVPSTEKCVVNSTVFQWTEWAKCLFGSSQRTRFQYTIPPLNNGATLNPDKEQDPLYCPVDCKYEFDKPKTTCDYETGTNKYTVKNYSPPLNNGQPCVYQNTTILQNGQVVPSTDKCKVDCSFAQVYDSCDTSGFKIYNVGYYHPPINNGAKCSYNGTEIKGLGKYRSTDLCRVDCSFQMVYDSLDVNKFQVMRILDDFIPAVNGGLPCKYEMNTVTGPGLFSTKSIDQNCTGYWDSNWSECSAKCGGGEQTRKFHITRNKSGSGADCTNKHGDTVKQTCNTIPCCNKSSVGDGSANDYNVFSRDTKASCPACGTGTYTKYYKARSSCYDNTNGQEVQDPTKYQCDIKPCCNINSVGEGDYDYNVFYMDTKSMCPSCGDGVYYKYYTASSSCYDVSGGQPQKDPTEYSCDKARCCDITSVGEGNYDYNVFSSDSQYACPACGDGTYQKFYRANTACYDVTGGKELAETNTYKCNTIRCCDVSGVGDTGDYGNLVYDTSEFDCPKNGSGSAYSYTAFYNAKPGCYDTTSGKLMSKTMKCPDKP